MTRLETVPNAILGLTLFVAACGGGTAPPEAGSSRGVIPDLRGTRVMVLPVQSVRGLEGPVDPEIAFGLEQRGGERVEWVLPDALRRLARRSPGSEMPVDALPVGAFLRAEVERVGDPLYGHLRRLAAVSGADIALLPVEARLGAPGADGSRAEIAASLIDARTGRVYWFGVVAGRAGEAGDPALLASAAEALARTVVR